MAATRMLVADGLELVRAGLCALLERQPGHKVVALAADGLAAVSQARQLKPDIALIELALPRLGGVQTCAAIAAAGLATRVVILALDAADVGATLAAGAKGYLLKSDSPAELQQAIDAVRGGGVYFSPQVAHALAKSGNNVDGTPRRHDPTNKEREVLQLLASGKSNKEIAVVMGITPKTVETHRARLMAKLEIHTVPGLTKYALRHGLATLDD